MEYIDVTLEDIELANQLAHEVLGRSLDEMPPQTRKLLKLIGDMVARECELKNLARHEVRFTRKQIRDVTGWGNTQLKLHLARLEDMEFLGLHNMPRSKTIVYELLFDGEADSDERHLMGLINTYDLQKSGVVKEKSGHSRPQVGPVSAHSRAEEIAKNTEKPSVQIDLVDEVSKNALLEKRNGDTSYKANIIRESNTFPLAASTSTELHNSIEV
jgi:hypothetical protein